VRYHERELLTYSCPLEEEISDMSDDSQSDGDKSHEQDCVNGEEKSEKATDVSSTTATEETEHTQRQIKSSIAKVSSSIDGVLGASVNKCINMQRRRTSFGPDTAAQLRKAAGMYFLEEGSFGGGGRGLHSWDINLFNICANYHA